MNLSADVGPVQSQILCPRDHFENCFGASTPRSRQWQTDVVSGTLISGPHPRTGFRRKLGVRTKLQVGQSGGGCLAAGLSLFARDHGEPHISAQFLLYPMLDDRTSTAVDRDPMPSNGEFVWTRNSNHFAWASVLGHEPGEEEVPVYAAPGRALNLTGLPPSFICVGSLDLFLGKNLRFARSLTMGGVPTELHVYPGAYHAFTSFSPEADISKRALREFWSAIGRHFR